MSGVVCDEKVLRDGNVLYTFKIFFNHYEIICAGGEENDCAAWIDALTTLSPAKDTIAPVAMDMREPEQFKQISIQELSNNIEKLSVAIERKIDALHGATIGSESSTTRSVNALGITINTQYADTSHQMQTLIDVISNDPESVTQQLKSIKAGLNLELRHSIGDPSVSERISRIHDIVEFISKSNCKLVDLFTDQLKGMRSPQRIANDDSRVLEMIDSLGDRVIDSHKSVKLSLDALVSRMESGSGVDQGGLLSKIKDRIESLSISTQGPQLTRIQDSIESLGNRLSTLSQPRSSAQSSPEKHNSNLLMSMNDKLVKISINVDDQHDSQKGRLSSIDEKMRVLVSRTVENKVVENDGKEMRILNEVKSSIIDLEHRMTRAGKDQKAENETLQAAMTRVCQALQTSQGKRSTDQSHSLKEQSHSSVDQLRFEFVAYSTSNTTKLAQIEATLGLIQERLATRTMRKSTSSSEIASKSIEQKLDIIQHEVSMLKSSGASQPLSMNDDILKIMRGESVFKHEDPLTVLLVGIQESLKSDKIERGELTKLVKQTLLDNKEMRGAIREIHAHILKQQ